MVGIISRVGMIINAAIGGIFCLVNRSEIGAALEQIREEEAKKEAQKRTQKEAKDAPCEEEGGS